MEIFKNPVVLGLLAWGFIYLCMRYEDKKDEKERESELRNLRFKDEA